MKNPARSVLDRKYHYRPPRLGHARALSSPWTEVSFEQVEILPQVDWRQLLTPIRDQGREGDCFAFAGAALKEAHCAFWAGGTAPLGGWLSPAYLAWRVRLAEGTFPSDSGASLADTMEVLRAWGICPETWLPYKQDFTEAGNAGCDVAAEPYRLPVPCIVDWSEPDNVKRVLSSKRTVAVGFRVEESWERTGSDGIVPPLRPGDGMLGGHAVLCVGYDSGGWLIRNSWGTGWGKDGYAVMPYGYEAETWLEAWTA